MFIPLRFSPQEKVVQTGNVTSDLVSLIRTLLLTKTAFYIATIRGMIKPRVILVALVMTVGIRDVHFGYNKSSSYQLRFIFRFSVVYLVSPNLTPTIAIVFQRKNLRADTSFQVCFSFTCYKK